MIVGAYVLITFLISWFLSIAAYQGGFSVGCFKTIKKAERFEEFVRKQDNPLLSREWDIFLTRASVQNNKSSYFEWITGGWDK